MRLLLALFLFLGALRDAHATTASVGPDGNLLVDGRLRAGGAPRGRLSVKGVGIGLPDLSLPLVLPVTAQLVASDTGACWESALASATRNTSTQFKAR